MPMTLREALSFLRATGSLFVKLPDGRAFRFVLHDGVIRAVIDETEAPRVLYPQEAYAVITEIAQLLEQAEAFPSFVEVPIRQPERVLLVEPTALLHGGVN